MKWIQTGRQLGKAVKNVQRLKQIIAVFARHGFGDLVHRMDLAKFFPGKIHSDHPSPERTLPERLRSAFEELGPTFVKLGQLLSTRSDLLPEAFIEEFTNLQDDVHPLAFQVVKAAVEKELGRPIEEAYASFSQTPLAAASIGQVHEAVLKTGEKVVVKVQRPEIAKLIQTDVSLLAFIASLLEKYIPESRIIGPTTIVDEFFRTLSYELDFVVEANNMAKIAENMRSMPEIVIPVVYKELSTHKILTLEKLEGIRIHDLSALKDQKIDRKKIVELGARAFFRGVMIDGLFHGDLHGGNLFVLPGNKLGIIDFGIVGRLSQKSRDQLASMLISLLTEDYETLCYEYAELGVAESSIDFDGFQREVRNTLSPYMGLALSDLNIGRVLIEATKIATRYQIQIPGDWMLVFKAILTIEGMGRTLDPEFDILSMSQELVKDLVKNRYSLPRLKKELLWVGKDVGTLLKVLPRQIRWMLRKFNSNDFAFEIKSPDFKILKDQLDVNGRRMSLSILVAGLFISSSLSLGHASPHEIAGYPLFSVVSLALGSFCLLSLFFQSFRK